MERAALFKTKNYGKLISDVSIVTESNHKRVMDILCRIFQDVLKRPTTAVSATWKESKEIHLAWFQLHLKANVMKRFIFINCSSFALCKKFVPYGTNFSRRSLQHVLKNTAQDVHDPLALVITLSHDGNV